MKIYKVVFNFKIALKSVRNVVTSRFIAVFNSKSIFRNFLNFLYQICFEILIYCDSTNKVISVSIELAHLLLVFILHAHFSQLSLIASFSHLFSLTSTIMFIEVTIFFILMSAVSRYSFFISFIFIISFIFAFKEINFFMFRFRIHSEREIIKIVFIEIFDYQIVKNKNLDMCWHKNLNFQLLMKRLMKKNFWYNRIYKKSYMT